MEAFLEFLVKQKKFAIVFSLAFIAIGVLSVVGMQRDQFPTVDFEVLSVTTAYPGASPEDVEKKVTNIGVIIPKNNLVKDKICRLCLILG